MTDFILPLGVKLHDCPKHGIETCEKVSKELFPGEGADPNHYCNKEGGLKGWIENEPRKDIS